MRGQDHEINIFPFFIQKGGIKAFPDQLPFALLSMDGGNKSAAKKSDGKRKKRN